jgi:trehalose 6-phosphate phosphatase
VLPKPTPADALFLDFDGTLVDIAPSPADVMVTPALLQLLQQWQTACEGALAVISGRPIADLDALLQPFSFAAAGEHGAELRLGPGLEITQDSSLPAAAADAIAELAAGLPGTELELKRASASLHYRRAPETESRVIEGMRGLEGQYAGYALILGKMVAELKPAHVDKGVAIRELCARAPFVNRRPVFVGDDVTDEPGFQVVNELQGLSIRVGGIANSNARYSLDSVRDVHAWLKGV